MPHCYHDCRSSDGRIFENVCIYNGNILGKAHNSKHSAVSRGPQVQRSYPQFLLFQCQCFSNISQRFNLDSGNRLHMAHRLCTCCGSYFWYRKRLFVYLSARSPAFSQDGQEGWHHVIRNQRVQEQFQLIFGCFSSIISCDIFVSAFFDHYNSSILRLIVLQKSSFDLTKFNTISSYLYLNRFFRYIQYFVTLSYGPYHRFCKDVLSSSHTEERISHKWKPSSQEDYLISSYQIGVGIAKARRSAPTGSRFIFSSTMYLRIFRCDLPIGMLSYCLSPRTLWESSILRWTVASDHLVNSIPVIFELLTRRVTNFRLNYRQKLCNQLAHLGWGR